MSAERARDARFGGEKTENFLQGFPEVVLHVEVGWQMLAHHKTNHLNRCENLYDRWTSLGDGEPLAFRNVQAGARSQH